MVMRRRSRGFSRFGGGNRQRRKMFWTRTFIRDLSSNGTVTDLLATYRADMGILQNMPGTTLIRTIVSLHGQPTASPTEGNRLVWGIREGDLHNPPAVADNPVDAETSDWVVVSMGFVANGSGAASVILGPGFAQNGPMDIRAMRKLDESARTLFFIWDNPDGQAFDLNVLVQCLFKLP